MIWDKGHNQKTVSVFASKCRLVFTKYLHDHAVITKLISYTLCFLLHSLSSVVIE